MVKVRQDACVDRKGERQDLLCMFSAGILSARHISAGTSWIGLTAWRVLSIAK
jgi:hypothetical protein